MSRVQHNLSADGKTLGRLASEVASRLIGKHKVTYQPHIDDGDIVHVADIEKVTVTGKKMDQKVYHHHTGHPGGLKTKGMRKLYGESPAKVLEAAVWRMLPKNKHRKNRLSRLTIS